MKSQTVWQVNKIEIRKGAKKGDPDELLAFGETNTGGWTEIKLRLIDDGKETGEWIFQLEGKPPVGFAIQTLTAVESLPYPLPINVNVKKITIKGQSNHKNIEY